MVSRNAWRRGTPSVPLPTLGLSFADGGEKEAAPKVACDDAFPVTFPIPPGFGDSLFEVAVDPARLVTLRSVQTLRCAIL